MEIAASDLVRMIAAVADDLETNKDELCRLDGLIGDADHGIAMALGFGAARDAVTALGPEAEPSAVLNAAAKAFLSGIGASCGPLYATALMRAGASVKGKARLDDGDAVALLRGMETGIRDRGKAEPGQKTMLDAWAPAASAAEAALSAGNDLPQCFDAAVMAARDGAEATRQMVATKGRAERLGDRSLGHVDPGAASAVMVIAAMARALPA